jgi:hypothetical protein
MKDYAARPPMTAAELGEHKVTAYGRDYSESDDGYGDMAAEEKRGWGVLPSWGRDGWNLGDWPYVVVYVRDRAGEQHELMVICEGDRTIYAFDMAMDRTAAIDYMFAWYAAGQRWAEWTWEDRERLDVGHLEVDLKFRGPYRQES